ncbi:MAG: DUF177 domain-containing protein [Balneolaceae bacterium]
MGAIVETEKLTFHLQEIPEGQSKRTVDLTKEDLILENEVRFLEAKVDVNFYKTNHFVDVTFNLVAKAELICDRSLRAFEEDIEGSYHVHFDPNPVDDSETDKGAIRQIQALDFKVDISKEVIDTIMLKVPIRKIHPDFLDEDGNPVEYETQKFSDNANKGDDIDPRWSALKKLK